MVPDTVIRGAEVWGHGYTDVHIVGNRIAAIGEIDDTGGADIFDATGCLVYPGWVNTHHHLAQSLQKGIPASLNLRLDDWLHVAPYACWPHFTPEMLYIAAKIGLSELLLSGATTCADHHYLYQMDTSPEMEAVLFQAAEELGIRFVLCRGGASDQRRERKSDQPTLEMETLDVWLRRLSDTISDYHQIADDAMKRVVVAPTSLVHSTRAAHLQELADFARAHKVRMHSHLMEVESDEAATRERCGLSPVEYASEHGWLGSDVWYAHLVHCSESDIELLAQTGTGIAHCPVSNCRLGSGIASVPLMASRGVPVSLGVDGSASAEAASMSNEAMQAWLLHRTTGDASVTQLDEVVRWGTEGGAGILGLDTGRLSVGACADLSVYDLSELRYAGLWSRSYAPVICGEPVTMRGVMVDGRWRVIDDQIVGLDTDTLRQDAAAMLRTLRQSVGG